MRTLPTTNTVKWRGNDVSEGDKAAPEAKEKPTESGDPCRLISLPRERNLWIVPIAVELAVMNQHHHFTAFEN
jgi:hypothetical protein